MDDVLGENNWTDDELLGVENKWLSSESNDENAASETPEGEENNRPKTSANTSTLSTT